MTALTRQEIRILAEAKAEKPLKAWRLGCLVAFLLLLLFGLAAELPPVAVLAFIGVVAVPIVFHFMFRRRAFDIEQEILRREQ